MADILPPLFLDDRLLAIPRASATQDGYLSREDYILFATSGGSSVPVTSFNTRTGDIILFEDDVLAALGYVPLNTHGDTMTGPLTLSGNTLPQHAATRAYVQSMAGAGGALPGDIPLSNFNASGSASTYTGSVSSGSKNLAVNIATDFQVGQGIYVAGAASGQPLITKVDAVSGTSITLHAPATSTVTNQKVQHDDTDAWQAALDAMGAAGSGRILAFKGRFRCNKPTSTYSAILHFPFNVNSISSPLPTALYSIVGNLPSMTGNISPVQGTIIETEVRNAAGWIMSAGAYQTADFIAGNLAYIYIQNVVFRTYDNPEIGGLDLSQVWSVTLKDVGCDTGDGTLTATFPTHGTIGVRLPLVNMCTDVYTERLVVRQYAIGVVADELWRSVLTWIEHCGVGWQSHDVGGNYPTIGDFIIGGCPIAINAKARLRVDIHVQFEEQPSGQYAPQEGGQFLDATNTSTGIVRYYAYKTPAPGPMAISWTGCDGITMWSLEGFGIKWAKQTFFQLPLSTDLQVRDLTVRGKTYLNDGAAEERITFGTADSGGTGFRHAIAPNATTTTLLTGLVSYWKFEEAAGIRYDQTGVCNLQPPAYADAVSAAGKIGNCLAGGGLYLYGPFKGSTYLSGSFSATGWVNFNVAAFDGIFGSWPNDGANNSFVVLHRTDTNSLDFLVSPNGSASSTVSIPLIAATGTWYFFAAVYDQGASQIKLSLNGAAFVTLPFTGPIHAPVSLAVRIFGGSQANINLDELGLWSKPLTIGEVGALYAGGAGLSYPF